MIFSTRLGWSLPEAALTSHGARRQALTHRSSNSGVASCGTLVGRAQLMDQLVPIAAYGTLIAAAGECALSSPTSATATPARNVSKSKIRVRVEREFGT